MKSENKNANNRKITIAASLVGVLIVAGVIGSALLIKANATGSNASYKPLSMKQALALPKDGVCLANNDTVKTTVEGQKGLGEDDGLWTSQIYDVPAGTVVDVNIASYNESDTITGSLVYLKQYGSYNFTVTKQADGWRYTQFVGCE